jgi:hypothetical protein
MLLMAPIVPEDRVVNSSKFPVNFPVIGNLEPRDGFAADCVLRQTVSRPENGSLIPSETARFRAFSELIGSKTGTGVCGTGLKYVCFLYWAGD